MSTNTRSILVAKTSNKYMKNVKYKVDLTIKKERGWFVLPEADKKPPAEAALISGVSLPMSALTSCLTPPHPVDILLFFFFNSSSSPAPPPLFHAPSRRKKWQQMGHHWRGAARRQPRRTYSQLPSIFAHWGEKKQTDETRRKEEKIKCVCFR